MATWHDLPQELLVSILQYIFAGKRVTFGRRPRATDPHATKLLSILTVSKTFINHDVVLGAMLDGVDVVLYSIIDLYKLAVFGKHDKRALRSVAVTTDCLVYYAANNLSLREVKCKFPGIQVIDLGNWQDFEHSIPALNVSKHSVLFALDIYSRNMQAKLDAQAAQNRTFPAQPSSMSDPVGPARGIFNLEEECRHGYMDMQEASTLIVKTWEPLPPRLYPRPKYHHPGPAYIRRNAWLKSLLVNSKSLQVEIKFWRAIDIRYYGQNLWRVSVSKISSPLEEEPRLKDVFRLDSAPKTCALGWRIMAAMWLFHRCFQIGSPKQMASAMTECFG